MTVERSVTKGNILSMMTTAMGFLATVITVTLYIADIRRTVETKDAEHDIKIERLERDMSTLRADHDTIIEMRQDVKAIRAVLDRLERRGPEISR